MSARVLFHLLAAGLAVAIAGLAPLPLHDDMKLYVAYALSIPNAIVVAYLGLTSSGITSRLRASVRR